VAKHRKLSLSIITIILFTLLFQPKIVFSEENGTTLNGLTRYDLIDATGIGSPSVYSADKRSVSFIFQFNFKFDIIHERTLMIIETDPALAPYIDHLEVVDNMGHGHTPISKFSLTCTTPGTFIFDTERAIQTCACGFTHTGVATFVLNTPVDQLPEDMYLYSLKLVNPRFNNSYINKSRVQGVIEKYPDIFNFLDIDYGVFKSFLGFNIGRPLSYDTTLTLKYCVSFAFVPLRACNFVFKFDPDLINYIDHVDIYSSITNQVVSSQRVSEDGTVSVPSESVYPLISLFKTMPINAKVYFTDGCNNIGSLPKETYKITAMTTTTSVTSLTDILINSICTTGFKTNID